MWLKFKLKLITFTAKIMCFLFQFMLNIFVDASGISFYTSYFLNAKSQLICFMLL